MLVFRGGTLPLDKCLNAPSCTLWGSSAEETWLDVQFNRSANEWRITDGQGVVYWYGSQSAQARASMQMFQTAQTFSWALTDVIDPNGNRIHITYLDTFNGFTNAHSYPQTIEYGGNATAGLSPLYRVTLTYDTATRPDMPTNYRAGFADTLDQRVTGITVSLLDPATPSPVTIRTYGFTYTRDPDTGQSLLETVSLTGADSTTPPPATTFTYSQSARALDAGASLSGLPTFAYPSGSNNFSFQQHGYVDVDGDGLVDYLRTYDWGNIQIYRNVSFRSAAIQHEFEPAPGNLGDVIHDPVWGDPAISGPRTRLIDMDGDGLPDFVYAKIGAVPGTCCVDEGSGVCPGITLCEWQVHRNLGGGTLATTPTSWPGVPGNTLKNWLGRGPGFDPRAIPAELVDLNGDGRADLLDCTNWNATTQICQFYQNTGNAFAPPQQWWVPNMNDGIPAAQLVSGVRTPLYAEGQIGTSPANSYVAKRLLDLNGDGLADLVVAPLDGTGWQIAFNTGKGFAPPVTWTTAPTRRIEESVLHSIPTGLRGTIFGLRDVNGDGLPDIVSTSGGSGSAVRWTVQLNTGDGFGPAGWWEGTQGLPYLSVHGGYWLRADVLDVNGDGLADFVGDNGFAEYPTSAALATVRAGSGVRGALLTGITNGLGGTSAVSYIDAHRQRLPSPSCPLECYQLPFGTWVVNEVHTRSGRPGIGGDDLATQFRFLGGHFDTGTHQFRGFRRSIETRLGGSGSRIIERMFAPPPFRGTLTGADTSTWPASWPSPLWPGGVPPSVPFKLVNEIVRDNLNTFARTGMNWDAVPRPNGRCQLQLSTPRHKYGDV